MENNRQKALFIAFNEALKEEVVEQLHLAFLKGYTAWDSITGAGSNDGEPHLGDHAWPTMNSAILVFAPQAQAEDLKKRMELLDMENPSLGLRVFTWNID